MNDVAGREALDRVPFWFLRHGETEWNARGVSQGNVDIPLNPTGLAQAQSGAALLRNRGVATIVSSPLSRARMTAELAAEALGLSVVIDPDLREARFGVQEGQPMSDWYAEWIAGRFTPEGGEPFAILRQRAVAAVNRATRCPPAVLVVSHGALFRALRDAMGLAVNQRTPNAVPIWCEPRTREWSLKPVHGAVEIGT